MRAQEAIRVLVVDDHIIVREGLESLLDAFPDLELVGEAENGRTAVELSQSLKPDVILMDLIMPDMNGIEAIKKIRRQNKQVQVLALTSFSNKTLVKEALEAGAIGYLLKNVPAVELAQAIRNAYRTEPTLAPEATKLLLETMVQPSSDYGLSDREKEVLREIVTGLKNEEIALSLKISISTVKNHVSNILAKLNVSSRTKAATKAVQEQLLEP